MFCIFSATCFGRFADRSTRSGSLLLRLLLFIDAMSLAKQVVETLLTLAFKQPMHEDMGQSHTQSNAQDDKRSLDKVVHGHRYLTDNARHFDEGKERTIHQYARNHGDNARYGDTLMGCMEPMLGASNNETDEHGACQRTDNHALVEANVTVAGS